MKRLDASARGVFIIAVTPFDAAGGIDLASLDRLIAFYLGHGVAGITILGMMGEAPKLAEHEARDFARQVLDRVAGQVPVVVGVSAPGFASMAALSQAVMAAGAAGVMVAPPPNLKGDEAVLGHFHKVAETLGADVPFVVQDFPLASGVAMSPTLIRRIADDHANCVMLKHEDWPGLDKLGALRRAEAGGARRLSILCGNGGLFLPFELARGADGAMTGYAYPEMLVEVCRLHDAGRHGAALDLFDAHLPLVRYEQQPGLGLAVRKHILHRRGAIACPALRPPGPTLTAETIAEIELMQRRLERALAALGSATSRPAP